MRQMFPQNNDHFRYTVENIISNQQKYFHGEDVLKYKYIPKVMDICLVKLYQLIEVGKYDQDEIIESFLLIDCMKDDFKDEQNLKSIKESINLCDWNEFINKCNKPKVIAQLFLDF